MSYFSIKIVLKPLKENILMIFFYLYIFMFKVTRLEIFISFKGIAQVYLTKTGKVAITSAIPI